MSEAIDCIQVLLAMTPAELEEVADAPNATALETIVARALLKSIEKSSLYAIDCLLTRAYGKPRETLTLDADMVVHTIHLT